VTRMSRSLVGLAILAAGCTERGESPMEPSSALADLGAAAQVTTKADDGPGSFRAAVARANSDPSIGTIRFAAQLGTVKLSQPVTYSGAQALVIRGEGVRLDGSGLPAGASAFEADGGGNLTIRNLTVLRAPGNGITIKVPDAASGDFRVWLDEVVIRENGLHGVLINDQAEYFTDPASVSEEGSAASLRVEVYDSRFVRNGFTLIDSDGLRVNEGGEGSLHFLAFGSLFAGNGADGLELDERAAGDADFVLRRSELVDNGAFTSEDYDDGIDVDEGGEGDLIGRFAAVTASRNFEQGLDLNENGPGDIRVTMADVLAASNFQEGVELEEDDDVAGGGGIEADLRRITTRGNGREGGDAGLKLREKGEGDLTARLADIVSTDNEVAAGGDPVAGIQVREDENGDLSGQISGATVRRNSGAGTTLEQEPEGTGEVRFSRYTAANNGEGAIESEGVAVSGAL
jgi:hypothetical protein